MDFLYGNVPAVLQPPSSFFNQFKLSQMQHRKVTTPTVEGSYPFDNQNVENALRKLLSEFDFSDATSHIFTLMELLCSELPFSDYSDDLKQELWWKSRVIYQLFHELQQCDTKTNI